MDRRKMLRPSESAEPTPKQSHLSYDDIEVDMTVVENFDMSDSDEEYQQRGASVEQTPTTPSSPPAPVIPNTKKRKKSIVWECFPEENIVTVGDARYAVCKYCEKKLKLQSTHTTTHLTRHMEQCLPRKQAVGKETLPKGQTVLGFTPIESHGSASITSVPFLKMSGKYEHTKVREALVHFILDAELPFNVVEKPGFNLFCSVLQPLYEKVGRKQAKADCERVVQAEAMKIKKQLDCHHRISLTTDLWKSDAQNLEYMVVTAHWVDKNTWTLQKRILSFVHVPPPRTGRSLAAALYSCFTEWGIQKKVHTITVDNATTNDACLRSLKEDFDMERSLVAGGRLFQVRCTAHIVNLLVQDAVKVIGNIIDKIRDGVKYIRASEARQKAFVSICQICGVQQRKLILDCPTRWNSTYQMLRVALGFQEVFPRYACNDGAFLEFCPAPPEWDRVESICDFLSIFNEVTERVSGTQYPTANLYFLEVFRIKKILRDREFDSNSDVALMVTSMKNKFEKYWGHVNLLMSLANTLDPRCKFDFIQYALPLIYGECEAIEEINNVRKTLHDLYEEYKNIIPQEDPTVIPYTQSNAHMGSGTSLTSSGSKKTTSSIPRQQIPSWDDWCQEKMKMKQVVSDKSELDIYIEDRLEEPSKNFNVLAWWQLNQHRYPILSRIAREILAIPISSVASENAFSVGSRVIDPYRASLSPKTVSMLMCGTDWIKLMYHMSTPTKNENEIGIEEVCLPAD